MPRPLSIALIAGLCFAPPAFAETDGEVYEEVDKIFAQAIDEVGENLAKFVQANERPLTRARTDLASLIRRMNEEKRPEVATALQKRLNTLEDTVQKRAGAKVPIVEPPKKPLLERLEGKWERANNPEYFKVERDGSVSLLGDADNSVRVTGRLTFMPTGTGDIRWSNGFRWQLLMAGEDAIAVLEWNSKGGRSADGIVLERMK